MTTPKCGLLFHFTHIDNLPAVLAGDALLSDSVVSARGLLSYEAGDPAIKERRRERRVTCPPGGFVADYVPFYFAARSPMMFKLSKGGVPSFTGDHRDLVYLVTSVDDVVEAGLAFAISDRNAAVAVAEFSNDRAVLGDLGVAQPVSTFIDWPLMNAQYWNDTLEHPDRMERRMAEFLVHQVCPLEVIRAIAVHSAARRSRVEHLFGASGRDVRVITRADWYYA
jgi:hypothetical protein